MAVQENYNEVMPVGYEGMISSTIPVTLLSREVEVAIGFGKVAVSGSAPKQIIPGTAADQTVIGITVRDQDVSSANTDGFPAQYTARVLNKGEIYVTAGGTATFDTDVYMVPATGRFVSASTDNLPIPGAKFVDSGVDGDLVRIELT